MCPQKYQAYKGKRKIFTFEEELKADAFSFGLSILEMGNLLDYENIKLNKEENLLN